MILKTKDPLTAKIQALEKGLAGATSNYERQKYERAVALTMSGDDGEKEAAYYLDFHLKESKNWIVIHDLRLELGERTAQIDHLLINRLLEIYVIESKNLKTKVRYENGGWERMVGKNWQGFPCPIEQNRRHIEVLNEVIVEESLTPVRLGFDIAFKFSNVVAVSPECSIVGAFPEDAKVWKMDAIVRNARDEFGGPLSIVRLISTDTLEDLGRKLVSLHSPVFAAKVRKSEMVLKDSPTPPPLPKPIEREKLVSCESCGGEVTKAEAYFCRLNKSRFASRLLCRKCQDFAPKDRPKEKAEPKSLEKMQAAAKCASCAADVDAKVVAFCRFNSKRLGGRVLCRDCQAMV